MTVSNHVKSSSDSLEYVSLGKVFFNICKRAFSNLGGLLVGGDSGGDDPIFEVGFFFFSFWVISALTRSTMSRKFLMMMNN